MTNKHMRGHVEFHPPAAKLAAKLPGDGQPMEEEDADVIGQDSASGTDCLVVTSKAHAEQMKDGRG